MARGVSIGADSEDTLLRCWDILNVYGLYRKANEGGGNKFLFIIREHPALPGTKIPKYGFV